jgi:hypothetical protein
MIEPWNGESVAFSQTIVEMNEIYEISSVRPKFGLKGKFKEIIRSF